MGQEQNFVIGVRTQIYFGIMPAESLAAEILTAPPNVLVTLADAATAGDGSLDVEALPGPVPAGTPLFFAPATVVTLSAAATLGATSLAVDALPAAIPAGSIIRFNYGDLLVKTIAVANSAATSISIEPLEEALADNSVGYRFTTATKVAYTSKHAKTGDTSIIVEPLASNIADQAIALHRGLVLLEGGTTSEEQIQAKDTETTVYGKKLPYSTGIVTGASWQVSYSFNVLPADEGYFRLKYAAAYALDGIRGWVKKMDPVPEGYTEGESIQGLCDVTDFSTSNPAEGIITGKNTFKGRGTPTIGHYA